MLKRTNKQNGGAIEHTIYNRHFRHVIDIQAVCPKHCYLRVVKGNGSVFGRN